MALFPFPVRAELEDNYASPTNKLRFGLSAQELVSPNLSRPIETWRVSVTISNAIDLEVLEAYLESMGVNEVFEWQSPRDIQPEKYRMVSSVTAFRRNGGGKLPVFQTRGLIFKRYYG